ARGQSAPSGHLQTRRRADRTARSAGRAAGEHGAERVSEKRTVAVRIRGQDFRIRSDEPPEQLARIARTVDETMERIESKTGAVDSYDVAMLTALNLA